MRAERVTTTRPADDAARLRAVVAAGLAPSVSAHGSPCRAPRRMSGPEPEPDVDVDVELLP